MSVTVRQLRDDFAGVVEQTRAGPVSVMDRDEEKLVVMSPETYADLLWRDRRAYRAEDLPTELIEAIRTARPADDAPDYDPWEDEPNLRPVGR